MDLTIYDFIFGGIILASTTLAVMRGVVNELLSLSTWIIAFFIMHYYASYFMPYLPHFIQDPLLQKLSIYLIAFVITAIIITFIKKILASIISGFGLSGLNYLLGGVFGVVRGFIIASFLVVVIISFNLDKNKTYKASHFTPLLTPIIKLIINELPSNLKPLEHQIPEKIVHNKLQEI